MNTKNFKYMFFLLIAFAITLVGCAGGPAPTEATETPAAPPEPEEVDLGEYKRAPVETARETCQDLPVWLQHDLRAINYGIYPTANSGQIADGQTEVTYVAFALVYINDRRVEFRAEAPEVYQFVWGDNGPEHFVFELDPQPYIDRALEILDGDVTPVQVTATWRWIVVMTAEQAAAYGYSEYDRWDWRVVDTQCVRLENVNPLLTIHFRPIQSN